MPDSTSAQRGAQTLGELLVTAGVVIVLFVVWQLWWTDATAGRAQAATTQTLTAAMGSGRPSRRQAPS